MKLTIFPDGRILGKHFASQRGIDQTRMDSKDRNPTRIPLHVEMQTQQVHRRLARRVPGQMADMRMAQRATDVNDLDLMIPSLDRTFVENRADDEERPHGVRLQDLGELRGGDGRGRRSGVADGGGTDYDVDFSGRADDGLHGGAVGDGRCVHCHFELGEFGFQIALEGAEGCQRPAYDDYAVDTRLCEGLADTVSDAASCCLFFLA